MSTGLVSEATRLRTARPQLRTPEDVVHWDLAARDVEANLDGAIARHREQRAILDARADALAQRHRALPLVARAFADRQPERYARSEAALAMERLCTLVTALTWLRAAIAATPRDTSRTP